jgi:hypothetical protein
MVRLVTSFLFIRGANADIPITFLYMGAQAAHM